jgi:hypothetical protein
MGLSATSNSGEYDARYRLRSITKLFTIMQTAKSFLLYLCLILATPVWASWVKVGETEDLTFYIDPSTFKKNDSKREILELKDYKQRDKSGAMSTRATMEYDCSQNRFRVVSLSSHSESMAGGQVLTSAPEGQGYGPWWDIEPNGPKALLIALCKK